MSTRATLVLLLLAATALAGCSGGGSPEADSSLPGSSGSSSSTSGAMAMARPWTAEMVPVSFDGNLGTNAAACVFPVGACEAQQVAPSKTQVDLDRPGVNFTGLDLTVTWTAQTPATATLTAGFMVMATCDGCNSTFYDEVSGTSPLHVSLSGESVPLAEDRQFHFYVYNQQGFVFNPAVPAFAFASVDQAFHVEGAVSLLVPPL
jgi:hypothetical protein